MNHVYRTIFNRASGVWQAVSELATPHGKSGSAGTIARSSLSAAHAARTHGAPSLFNRALLHSVTLSLIATFSFAATPAGATAVTSFADVGETSNERSAGSSAESLGDGPVYDAMLDLSVPQARVAFDQSSGEIHASVKTALIEDGRGVRDAAIDRLREGACGPSGAAMARQTSEPGAECDPHRSVVWARTPGNWGHVSSDGNAARLGRSTSGFLAGIDTRLAGDWRGGVLAGYGHSSFDVNDRNSSGASDDYHLGAYAGTQWGALALRAGAAYTWHEMSTSRAVAFLGYVDDLQGSYRANTAQVFGELGYGIDAGTARLEPFANLAYVNLHDNGFTERGGAAALTAQSQSTNTSLSTLGLHASTSFGLGGTQATATGTIGWQRTYGDTTPTSTLAFAAGGSPFSIAGVPLAKNSAVLNAGLDFAVGKDAALGVSYNGQYGSGSRDSGVRVDFRMKF